MLDDLSALREGRSRRISSWDTSGGNRDAWTIEPDEARTLAEIPGPGCIRHIWVTVGAQDEWYLRKTLLRMYWDGEGQPSVEAPLGDFFGVGHGVVNSYSCAVLNMSANPNDRRHAAMNCYFPMPFGNGARIEVVNQCQTPIRSFYFYVDFDQFRSDPTAHGRFHAKWRRENPCDGWVPLEANKQPEDSHDSGGAANLTDAENYLLLEAKGRGHYVGCNLSVHNLCHGWWGEGDDMIVIDGDKWPPDMHGTGSEDYFSHAWGMQLQNAYIYNGVSYHSGVQHGYNERITVYRYHIPDPVIFHESIRVSIEHGHANTHSNDYASTAYWYQTEPHVEFEPMPPWEARIPRPDIRLMPTPSPGPEEALAEKRERMARPR